MKIIIVGETRAPIQPFGGGGLGRATWEIATDLQDLGHEVTLYAPQGAQFDGHVVGMPAMFTGYDVMLDYSHSHEFSRNYPKALNLMGDRECDFTPHNCAVESEYMCRKYTGARITPQGCRVDEIPFSDQHGDYLLFMGANVGHKQPGVAREVAERAGKKIRFIGPGFDEVPEAVKWSLLGGALALICPYTIDASPRAPLEAAACGTPTICLMGDGTHEHVKDGITGFACYGVEDMVYAVTQLEVMNRPAMRAWVEREHSNRYAAAKLERLLAQVCTGEKW